MQIWQCQAAEISSKKLLRAREKKKFAGRIVVEFYQNSNKGAEEGFVKKFQFLIYSNDKHSETKTKFNFYF